MRIDAPLITGSLNYNGNSLQDLSTYATTSSVNNLVQKTGSYALTGSNYFSGSQVVSGSITATGNITAQTLIIQTITSSVLFTTGSNIIGSSLSNVQQLTGSVGITGSLAINGTTAVVGSGTANYVPKFTASGTIGNSAIQDSGSVVGVNTSNLLTWYSGGYMAMQFGGMAGLLSNTSNTSTTSAFGLSYNLYTDSAGNYQYMNSTNARAGSIMTLEGGNISFSNAPAGTGTNPTVTERMRITAAGNVVVNSSGTSAPNSGQIVNKQRSDATTPYLNGIVNMAYATSAYLNIYYDNSVHIIAATYYTGGDGGAYKPLTFQTGDVERVRITTAGFTKISNDGTYLNSVGTYHEIKTSLTNNVVAYFINSSASPYGPSVYFTGAAPNNATNYYFNCADTGADRFTARSNGGLANYAANDVNLSDIRTKKDIVPLGSYWNKFKAIEIVKFKYKDQSHDDYNIGVISQQVESVAPEFVDIDGFGTTPEDGIPLKSIYTADLYHATIKVLQEAMIKIETLEEEIEILKNK
jgi:hypothetical protein